MLNVFLEIGRRSASKRKPRKSMTYGPVPVEIGVAVHQENVFLRVFGCANPKSWIAPVMPLPKAADGTPLPTLGAAMS